MIGLGTMGRNLLLNMADHGFSVSGYDKDPAKTALLESSATPGTQVKGAASLQAFISSLKTPRRVMMLVPAGPIVDAVISDLLPLLEKDDIIIDGGNSHFTDTQRRLTALQDKQVRFIGMGVSGGEKGARFGPSIMPGGDMDAWKALQPILEAVSAKVNNEPCVAYMGNGAAGHYVKMVHNGIEYATMQLISESYDLLKRGCGLSNDALHELFKQWNEGDLRSYLTEITRDIFLQPDEFSKESLLDMILDIAGSKGTGRWTAQDAMDIGVPVPSVSTAVAMRDLSSYAEERKQAAALYRHTVKPVTDARFTKQVEDALYASILLCYAQGIAQLQKASADLKMNIPVTEVIRIWRGGCIIRSSMLDLMLPLFKKDKTHTHLLLHKKIAQQIRKRTPALRKVIRQAVASRIPVSGFMSTLGYLESFSSEKLPVNLIQAQRDYFGAHTYQRTDREGVFHTNWQSAG